MSRQRSMEKILVSEYVSIGELVRITGCRYSTLKFYTEEGMLPFEQAEENLTRRFPREAVSQESNRFVLFGRTDFPFLRSKSFYSHFVHHYLFFLVTRNIVCFGLQRYT